MMPCLIVLPSGSYTGVLISYEIRTWDDMPCCVYPWAEVVLDTGTYYFDGEYKNIEELIIGNEYEFVYGMGCHEAGSTAGEYIEDKVLLWINEK